MELEDKRHGASVANEGRKWEETVEEIYRTHFAGLCRSVRRYLDTQHAAEEVVQEAFSRFVCIKRSPAPGSEVAYVRSIAMNEARSVLRHRQVRQRHSDALRQDGAQDATADEVMSHVQSTMLRTQLAALSERQRQVVELRFLAGFSERETAKMLSISAGSVKTHSSRGLASIRTLMEAAA